jgi:maltose-binding protein MalE
MRVILSFCLLFALTLSCYGFDVLHNGTSWREYSDTFLRSHSYAVPLGNNTTGKGISLDELFPPLIDAYQMKISTTAGTKTLRDDMLAEILCESYLVEAGPGWDLIIKGKEYNDVTSANIYGEKILSDTLEMWISWEGIDLLKQEIARYAEMHDISIDVSQVPSIDSKLVSVLRGGAQPPDIVMVQSDYLARLAAAEAIQPLDYMRTEGLLPKGVEAFRLDQRSWALPFYFDTQLVFFNTEYIKHRPDSDWTLAELETFAAEMKERGVTPISWNAYSAYWLVPFQKGFGKNQLLEEDGSITIEEEATREALHYILDLQEKGYLEVKERDGMISQFVTGEIAMILTGSYSIPHFEKLDIPFDVAPYPINQNTGLPVSPLLDFKAFAITRKTRHPLLAKRLLQYLTGIGVQQRFPSQVAKLPVAQSALRLAEQNNPYFDTLEKSFERGTVVPPEPAYKIYKNTMWKLLRFILTGQMSIDATLKKGQALIDEKLKHARLH